MDTRMLGEENGHVGCHKHFNVCGLIRVCSLCVTATVMLHCQIW